MQPQNIAEYRLIRNEMASLKNCVTNYIGFVLGGAATGLITILLKSKKTEEFPTYATATILVPVIMVFVIRVLFYKFNSHNRYAGYCKLLAQERYRIGDVVSEIHIWEACMAILRKSDADNSELARYSRQIESTIRISGDQNWSQTVEEYSGRNTAVVVWEGFKGMGLFLWYAWISKGPHWSSWSFPVPIVAIFFILTTVFLAAWLYFAVIAIRELPRLSVISLPSVAWYLVLLFLIIDWYRFFGKLYKLMKGSLTVDAFCYKFLPIRYALLSDYRGFSYYGLIGVQLPVLPYTLEADVVKVDTTKKLLSVKEAKARKTVSLVVTKDTYVRKECQTLTLGDIRRGDRVKLNVEAGSIVTAVEVRPREKTSRGERMKARWAKWRAERAKKAKAKPEKKPTAEKKILK